MRDLKDWKGCPPPAPVTLEGRTVRIEPYDRARHLQALWDGLGGMAINPLLLYFAQPDFTGIEGFDAWSEAMIKGGWVREVIVDKADGKVVGFAYAAPYRTRSAYRHTVEDSIYVAVDAVRRGIGSALLAELIQRCTALGYRQMVAVIGDSANAGSISLHASQGFVRTGLLPSVGCKFGRWVDSVLMQRPLGSGDREQPPARQA